MPASVRNFWIEADIDGRASRLQGGPASKDGGFSLTITMRDEGRVAQAARIGGHVRDDGQLVLYVHAGDAGECSELDDGYGFTIITGRDRQP